MLVKKESKLGIRFLTQIKKLIASEKGEVEAGMVGGESIDSGDSDNASFDGFGTEDTTGATIWEGSDEPELQPEPQPVQVQQQAPQQSEESFVDPATLPPELKSHWSRMHRQYTKALEATRGVQEKAQLADRFYSDPQFAAQTVAQWAMQNGVEFVPRGQQVQQSQGPQGPQVPQQIVDAMRQQLKVSSPELEWMAPNLAPAMWAAVQQAIAPIVQHQQQLGQYAQQQSLAQQQAAQQHQYGQALQTYEQLAKGLEERHPGWSTHEDHMTDLLEFFVSPDLHHPVHGSKLELLYNLVTGGSAATQKAVKRMNDATRLRAGSGKVGRAGTANVADRVRDAKTRSDAFRIAGEAALAQLD